MRNSSEIIRYRTKSHDDNLYFVLVEFPPAKRMFPDYTNYNDTYKFMSLEKPIYRYLQFPYTLFGIFYTKTKSGMIRLDKKKHEDYCASFSQVCAFFRHQPMKKFDDELGKAPFYNHLDDGFICFGNNLTETNCQLYKDHKNLSELTQTIAILYWSTYSDIFHLKNVFGGLTGISNLKEFEIASNQPELYEKISWHAYGNTFLKNLLSSRKIFHQSRFNNYTR